MTSTPTHERPEFDNDLLEADSRDALGALERAGQDAPKLVKLWLEHRNLAALMAAAERGSGMSRKLARRALNVLRSRGAVIEDRPRVATFGSPQGGERTEAWFLPPDATGGVVVILAAHTPASRYRTAFLYLHDEVGIHRVEVGEQSRSQLHEAMTRMAPGGDLKPVPVPVDWARFRVASARARHARSGMPLPLGLTSASNILTPVPETAPSHPLDAQDFKAASSAKTTIADSAALHQLAEFRAWLPPKAAIDAMLAQVGEQLNPNQTPEQDHLSKLMDEAVRAATDRFFSPQVRERLVSAMKDSALSVCLREGPGLAKAVLAAMDQIEHAGLITDPPHEIGFLRGFFEKAIAILAAQGGGNIKIPVVRPPEATSTNPDTPQDQSGETG